MIGRSGGENYLNCEAGRRDGRSWLSAQSVAAQWVAR